MFSSGANHGPGIYRDAGPPGGERALPTGVPAFLGFVSGASPVGEPHRITSQSQFESTFPTFPVDGYLRASVTGFFQNQGRECWVFGLPDEQNRDAVWNTALNSLPSMEDADLVSAPDLLRQRDQLQPDWDWVLDKQNAVLRQCDPLGGLGNKFAILDSWPKGDSSPATALDRVLLQRARLLGRNGALYGPWLMLAGTSSDKSTAVPPGGYVCGVIARTDAATGVYKAPANALIEGTVGPEFRVDDQSCGKWNDRGVNAIRALPGRGIRVWGARTLSADPAWGVVPTVRLLLTVRRWLEYNLGLVFEPHDQKFRNRITREITTYLDDLYQQGALKGASPEEAFYVRCDDNRNPPEILDEGQVLAEIGLAPSVPGEFICLRLVQSSEGIMSTA